MTINSQDTILDSILDENSAFICHQETISTEEASTKCHLYVSYPQDCTLELEKIGNLNTNDIAEETEFTALNNIYKAD